MVPTRFCVLALLLGCCFSLRTEVQNPYSATQWVEFDTGAFGVLTYNPLSANFLTAEKVIPNLAVNITYYEDTFNLHITDADNVRYEVPVDLVKSTPTATPNYTVVYTKSPFGITVTRKSDGFVAFKLDPSTRF
jgi:hypothetical protein